MPEKTLANTNVNNNFINNFGPLNMNYNHKSSHKVKCTKSKERNAKRNKIVRRLYPDKKLYWKKVKNEVAVLQKENNLFDNRMLKKFRCLQKLKAENLYLTSIIQHSLVIRSMLIRINEILTSPTPLLNTRCSDDASSVTSQLKHVLRSAFLASEASTSLQGWKEVP